MIETVSSISLNHIFNDQQYAWRLLEAQISMQMTPTVSGQQIAHLLELYMKGVQKMNSISDQRESYFKNKVTALMTKGVVIKSLKQNPMKKKNKPEEVTLPSTKIKDQQKKQKHSQKLKQPQNSQKNLSNKATIPKISHIELKQKQREFQMRIAYSTQESNPDALRKLMLQEQCRQENISKKINSIITNHEQRLQQRIKARKLRTATYRTHSQFNMNLESQTQPSSNKFNSHKKEDLYFFSNCPENAKIAIEIKSNCFENELGTKIKKGRSLQSKVNNENNKRKRKYSIEIN